MAKIHKWTKKKRKEFFKLHGITGMLIAKKSLLLSILVGKKLQMQFLVQQNEGYKFL